MPLYPPGNLDAYRADMRTLTTQILLDQREIFQWELADIDSRIAVEHRGTSLAYLSFKLDEINRELARREQLRAHPDAPEWPLEARIDRETVQRIKDRVDLQGLIEHLLPGTPWTQAGPLRKTNCPFGIHRDSDPSFMLYPDQHFFCFGCGIGGSVFDFIMAQLSLTFREAVDYLLDGIAPDPLTTRGSRARASKKQRIVRRDGRTITSGR